MLPTDQTAQPTPCPRAIAAVLPPDRQWVSEQLTLIQTEIRLLVISSAVTLCGIGAALVIFLLS